MSDEIRDFLRLPKRHASKLESEPSAADGAQLAKAQSVRDAIMAALIVVVLFSALWSILSALIDRIFPWMTLILGYLIGLSVRRAGQGLDWRFPTIAATRAALAELDAMQTRTSQYNPGNEIREKSWLYRFAKKHWFNDFGVYAGHDHSQSAAPARVAAAQPHDAPSPQEPDVVELNVN